MCHCALKAFPKGHSASPGPRLQSPPNGSPGMNQHLQRSNHRGTLRVSLAISEAGNQTAKHFSTHKPKTADLERPRQRAVLCVLKTESLCLCTYAVEAACVGLLSLCWVRAYHRAFCPDGRPLCNDWPSGDRRQALPGVITSDGHHCYSSDSQANAAHTYSIFCVLHP